MHTISDHPNEPPNVQPDTPSDARTLGDLLIRLNTAGHPDTDLRALRSAVLSTARLLDSDPAALAAHERPLLARLHKLHPREVGASWKRLRNVRSDLVRAFKAVGWHEGRNTTTFSPAWAALYDALPSKFARCALTRFIRYCCQHGIEPEAVDDEVIRRFRGYLDEVDFCRDPATMQRDLVRTWNRMIDAVEGWPRQPLALPPNKRRWSLGWDAFPPSLRADTEAWLAQQAGHDPLDEFGPARPLKPATIIARRQQTLMWASAIARHGRDPATLTDLAALVSIDAFKDALRHLLDPANSHGTAQPAALAISMLAAARHWVRLPEAQLKELQRLVKRVRPPRQGLTEKNRSILRQIDNPARRHDLLDFPRRVMDDVRRQGPPTRSQALRVQIALAVELLLMTVIRRGNLVALHLDRHLRWTRSPRGNTVHLVLDGREVKNGQDLAFELPPETVTLLETYLRDHHPLLAPAGNRFLFPGKGDGHKAAHRLSEAIKTHVFKETGLTVTAHSFRHIGVKLMLEDNPTNYESGRQLLGHTTVDTTRRHYAGEERAAHIRRYDELVTRERRKAVLPVARNRTAN
ncbi:tyrosine-type recombinase/integrase [Azospirillum sp. sgz302134]